MNKHAGNVNKALIEYIFQAVNLAGITAKSDSGVTPLTQIGCSALSTLMAKAFYLNNTHLLLIWFSL